MGALFTHIQAAAASGRVLISDHADEMFRERSIMVWQAVDGLRDGRLLRERPSARPNPVTEVEQQLADGTPFKAAWAYISALRAAKLVTVHFYDR